MELGVQCEKLCLMSIQHWLIKVTFAHRRTRPMGSVCVCAERLSLYVREKVCNASSPSSLGLPSIALTVLSETMLAI